MLRLHKVRILLTFSLLVIFRICHNYLFTNTTDVHEQLLDIHNFEFKINPQVCNECQDGFFVIITVISDITNNYLRSEIRQTWDKGKCRKIVFMVGASEDEAMNEEVLKENLKYGDVVQGNFLDNYRNMTYKHIMVLKWVTHHCQIAKYVVKIDDDFKNLVQFADVTKDGFGTPNFEKLYSFLKNGMWAQSRLLACRVNKSFAVAREGKYAVSQKEYPGKIYPDFCAGIFVIYSADVVWRLLRESREVPFFWIDDVHVTGTLIKRIGIKHVNLDPMWFMNGSVVDVMWKELSNKPLLADPMDVYKYWKIKNEID